MCLESTAQFKCSVTATNTEGDNFFYLVDFMAIADISGSRGITVYSGVYSRNATATILINVMGVVVNNNSRITCVMVPSNGSILSSSAYLSIQGQSIRHDMAGMVLNCYLC